MPYAAKTAPTVSPKIDAFLREQTPPTPFVVVDLDVVADRYHALTAAIPDARVYYAVKANPAAALLERLVALGSAFDVASPGEIDMCLAAGADPSGRGRSLSRSLIKASSGSISLTG